MNDQIYPHDWLPYPFQFQLVLYSQTFLQVGSADHHIHYYDLRNISRPVHVFTGHKKAVSYVKFLSNDELASASTDSTLRLWDVKQNLPVRNLTKIVYCSGLIIVQVTLHSFYIQFVDFCTFYVRMLFFIFIQMYVYRFVPSEATQMRKTLLALQLAVSTLHVAVKQMKYLSTTRFVIFNYSNSFLAYMSFKQLRVESSFAGNF